MNEYLEYLEEQQKYQAVRIRSVIVRMAEKEQLAQLRAYAKAWQKRCQKRMTVLDDRIVQDAERNGKSSAKGWMIWHHQSVKMTGMLAGSWSIKSQGKP